jgi:hypothetical protein
MTTPEQPATHQEEPAMQNPTRRSIAAGLLALALVGAGGGAAQAKGGGGQEVRTSGSCSAASDWKLKAKSDDGRLEVELEVDSNRVGQTWQVSMSDNAVRFFSGSRVTQAPSGSFEVEKRVANKAGADRITAVATNPTSGERCSAALSFSG